jgi:hypothetical protein
VGAFFNILSPSSAQYWGDKSGDGSCHFVVRGGYFIAIIANAERLARESAISG